MSTSKHTLDLHPVAKNGQVIEEALVAAVSEAAEKRIKMLEIIPGKGSGQLMRRVKKFLDRKDIKRLYKRVQVDVKNHGRLFVYFR